MLDPFALKTADPRFNPSDPVTVNGYLYIPAAKHDRRVTELLEANNRYLERARVAERLISATSSEGGNIKSPAAGAATPWRSEMKKLAILTLILAACTPAPAYAVVRGSAAVSVYPIGGGQCLYFQGSRYWIAPC